MIDNAIDRVMTAYTLMSRSDETVRADARGRVRSYLESLVKGGETDPERLTVCGLVYLREMHGRHDAVRSGFTGL